MLKTQGSYRPIESLIEALLAVATLTATAVLAVVGAGSTAPRPTTGAPAGGGHFSRRIRLVIADDHALIRELLVYQLSALAEVEVVGEAGNGREAVEAAETLKPDIVLMDMVMPGLNGLEATRQIRQRLLKTRVLVLSGFIDDAQIIAALRAGASGYVLKHSNVEELLLALRAVYHGNTYLSAALSEQGTDEYLRQAQQPEGKTGLESLSSREREILQLIAEGNSNRQIAELLVLSVKTVETHRSRIMAKLKARTTADLIRFAFRSGLITEEPGPRVTSGNEQRARR